MSEFDEPRNELEKLIAAAAGAGDAPEFPSRRAVIVGLATQPVTVMLAEPWDGTAAPETGPRAMLVSDGPDRDQAMLAVFTDIARAQDFQANHGGAEYPSVVPGPWAILATPEGAGIIVNPNQPLAFRVAPETIKVLRGDVAAAIEKARAGTAKP